MLEEPAISVPQTRRASARRVTGLSNPLLKVFRHALAEGVTRDGWLGIEGPNLLEEALEAGANVTVHSVVVAEPAEEKFRGLLEKLPGECEVTKVADWLFAKITQTETPQGIAALVELGGVDLDPLLDRPGALLVVACGLQDPGNLGTILRSAQALGATALITLEKTVSPFNPKAVRASAGAVFHLPVFPGQEARPLLRRVRDAGGRVVAADQRSTAKLSEADLRGPVALLIGMEAAGLAPEVAAEADLRLSIPIRAGTDSLNAAAAASIFLYEAARQRRFKY